MKAIKTFHNYAKFQDECKELNLCPPEISPTERPFLFLIANNELDTFVSIIYHSRLKSDFFQDKENGYIADSIGFSNINNQLSFNLTINDGKYLLSDSSEPSSLVYVAPLHVKNKEQANDIINEYNIFNAEGLYDYKIIKISDSSEPIHIKTVCDVVGQKNTISSAIDELKFQHLSEKIRYLTSSTLVYTITKEQLNIPFSIPLVDLLELKFCQVYDTNILAAKYKENAIVYNWKTDEKEPSSMSFSGVCDFPDFSLESFIDSQIKREIKESVTNYVVNSQSKAKKANFAH